MKTDRQKTNLLIDALLYVGFLLAMLLDVTGLSVHEWLGVAVVAVSVYHLLVHWRWVVTVATRFLKATSSQARRFLVVDAAMVTGFLAILLTGIVVSTWLELPLEDYPLWRDVHVYVSIATLAVVVLKVALHWRWIVTTSRRVIDRRALPQTGPQARSASHGGAPRLGRREFARVLAGVSVSAAYAGWAALEPLWQPAVQVADAKAAEAAQVAEAAPSTSPTPPATATAAATATATVRPTSTVATTTASATGRRRAGHSQSTVASRTTGATSAATPTTATGAATPTATAQTIVPAATATPAAATAQAAAPTATATAAAVQQCTVRCSRHCSYPGQCRKYVDANKNGLCDLGECL